MTATLDHRTAPAAADFVHRPDPTTRPHPIVEALCIIEDNTDRLLLQMWQNVVDALELGATLAEVSDACGEEPKWVVDHVIGWSDIQELEGRQTEEEGDRLRELLHAAGGPAPIPEGNDLRGAAAVVGGVTRAATLGDAWQAALMAGSLRAGRLTDYAFPAGHPTWCRPASCSAWAERGGAVTVFHAAILLDDGPDERPVEVQVRCSESIPADGGPASRSAARLYVEVSEVGVSGEQAVRLTEAVARASVLIGQDAREVA